MTDYRHIERECIYCDKLRERDGIALDTIISSVIEQEKGVIPWMKKDSLINYLMGKVMQITRGKADPIETLKKIKDRMI